MKQTLGFLILGLALFSLSGCVTEPKKSVKLCKEKSPGPCVAPDHTVCGKTSNGCYRCQCVP